MRLVLQRVTSAQVSVADEVVGAIARPGLLVLVGVTHDDTPATGVARTMSSPGSRCTAGIQTQTP